MSEQIKNMFSGLSRKYDILNDIFSFGIHRYWRKIAVKLADVREGDSVLDIATGTGDLAYEFQKAVGENSNVCGLDFSEEMLKIARTKYHSIDFYHGDALNLSFPDRTFVVSSISFGIRNVDSVDKCLKEMARVVKPGGRVVVLEFGQPIKLLRLPFKIFSTFFIPLVGKLLTGSTDAFHYLRNTSAKFPCREEFIKIMKDTDKFVDMRYVSLTMGIAYVYVGVVK